MSLYVKTEKNLVFMINEIYYGIPVLKMKGITSFKQVSINSINSTLFKDMIILDSEMIPVFDISPILNIPCNENSEWNSVVFIKANVQGIERIFGIVTNPILDLQDVILTEDKNLPISNNSQASSNIDVIEKFGKVDDKLVAILDIDKIANSKLVIDFFNNDYEKLGSELLKKELV